MALVGVPLAPGHATGVAHPIDGADATDWHRGGPGRVAIVHRAVWPPHDVAPPETVAAVLDRIPPSPAPVAVVPIVGGIDADVFVAGDRATVDGDQGSVAIDGVAETAVVTAFLERDDGRILLLRRSEKVGSFRGRWAAVSGYLEDSTPEAQAIREVSEETGLVVDAVSLARAGPIIYTRDGPRIWSVHPFRFRVGRPQVTIDWEHSEFEWVDPSEVGRRPVVPKLERAWAAVAPVFEERRKG